MPNKKKQRSTRQIRVPARFNDHVMSTGSQTHKDNDIEPSIEEIRVQNPDSRKDVEGSEREKDRKENSSSSTKNDKIAFNVMLNEDFPALTEANKSNVNSETVEANTSGKDDHNIKETSAENCEQSTDKIDNTRRDKIVSKVWENKKVWADKSEEFESKLTLKFRRIQYTVCV